jgi:hypothetical protein
VLDGKIKINIKNIFSCNNKKTIEEKEEKKK